MQNDHYSVFSSSPGDRLQPDSDGKLLFVDKRSEACMDLFQVYRRLAPEFNHRPTALLQGWLDTGVDTTRLLPVSPNE